MSVVCVVNAPSCVCKCEFIPAGTVGLSPSPAGFAGVLERPAGVPPGPCSCLGGLHCKSRSPAALVC